MGQFPQFNWTEFCSGVEESISVDMPEPLGKDADVRMMCGSDYAGEKGPDALALVFLSSIIWL
jgi:hypothetical protein